MTDMADETTKQQQFWLAIIAVIILLIFLYFYRPFETYLVAQIPFIHFSNVVFWFASLVGIVAYAFAHWQSFRSEIFRNVAEMNVDTLVFDTLQAAILAAVIFCAGGTLQAIEVLSEISSIAGRSSTPRSAEASGHIPAGDVRGALLFVALCRARSCGPAGVRKAHRRGRADPFSSCGCVAAWASGQAIQSHRGARPAH